MSYWTHLFLDHTMHDDMKAWKHFSIPADASGPHIPVLPPTTHPALKGKNPKQFNNYENCYESFPFLMHANN